MSIITDTIDNVKDMVYNIYMNCPFCNKAMVNVVYGFPTPEMIEQSKRDEIVLGGIPRDFDHRPTHYCLDCQEQYPQNEPENDMDTHTPMFSHSN
jgi:hypothetical protein